MRIRKRLALAVGMAALGSGLALPSTAGAAAGATGKGSAAAPNRCVHKYTFRNAQTGQYLDANRSGGQGTKVITWKRNGGANQSWCLEKASEGGWYLHPSYNHRLCMDSPTSGSDSPILWKCKGNANQRFNVGGGLIQLRRNGTVVTGEHSLGSQVFMAWRPGDHGNLSYWR